jgi:PRTRC genetic system protein B
MRIETQVRYGGQNRDFQLESAILVYADTGNRAQYAASVHDVELVDRRPVIKPGHPVTIQALEQLMRNLGRNVGAYFVPENLLSVGLDRMSWWCAAGRRRIWFKPSRQDDGKEKELKALNGRHVHHPPLLFVANARSLNVYALLRNERPRPDTIVYRAPYWNLSEGHMCNGDLKLPICTPENIPGFETAFFNSAFTHSSAGALTHHAGGHNGLWLELSRRKTPPDAKYWQRHLVRTPHTVRHAIQ